MAQVISITSEALQSTLRRLLPSQQGFGEDLQATNVVTPIIDLTPSAEGSSVPSYLQRAINFGGTTRINSENSLNLLATGGGFYEAQGTFSVQDDSTTTALAEFLINDGSTTTVVYDLAAAARATDNTYVLSYDLVFFLRPQDSLFSQSSHTGVFVRGSLRQIADSNGNLVNPVGFTPQ